MFKKALVGAAAASLAVSPAIAQSSSVEDGSGNPFAASGSPFAPVLFGGVIVFGVLLATGTWPFDEDENEDLPITP
ncbi:hypothetical protein [Sphingosinicella sp. BN140058]|uniref:hypothetical protein n=1 Tax=Sphingosinicella sp. BN140058 TaxID=1892855 RepID=UPI001011E5E1|nr:hypothetical protein [Sphingosinicella sp. BN140058]QAY78886.1 hypothetical protein ETR14_21850 [Sphingosinicella sp. BN140058]